MTHSSSWIKRALLATLVAVALLVVPACHLPTPLKDLDEPRLEPVKHDYQSVVHFAFHHPYEDWYYGWYGNFWRNWHRGNRRGLCYEWQAVVYEGVRESAPAAGFVAIGIMKDRDKSTEHHAVLLFEKGDVVSSIQGECLGPAAGRVLLDQAEPRRAWVLDAWRYGRADIFALDDWLGAPHHWKGRIEFEDLEAEYQVRVHKEELKRIEVVSDEKAASVKS